MSPAQLATLVRRKTHTTTTTYSNADLLSDANIYIDEIASAIQLKRPDVWHFPATLDLVANQREYALPITLNGQETVEMKLEDEYVYATPLKQRPKFALVEDNITAYYTNANPHYFIRRDSLYVLSGTITNVTAGIKITYNKAPAPLTDITSTDDMSIHPSTTTLGFPKEFHDLLARRLTLHYKNINSIELNQEDLTYEQELAQRIEEYSTPIQSLSRMISTPTDHFNNGYDL